MASSTTLLALEATVSAALKVNTFVFWVRCDASEA